MGTKTKKIRNLHAVIAAKRDLCLKQFAAPGLWHCRKKLKGLIYRILCIQNLQTNQDSQFFVFAFRYFEQSFLLEFKDRAPSNLSHFQRFFCAFPFQRFSVPTSIVSNTLLRFRRCLLLLLLTIQFESNLVLFKQIYSVKYCTLIMLHRKPKQ